MQASFHSERAVDAGICRRQGFLKRRLNLSRSRCGWARLDLGASFEDFRSGLSRTGLRRDDAKWVLELQTAMQVKHIKVEGEAVHEQIL